MSINPKSKSIKEFFENSDVYEVPPYQRDYKWSTLEASVFIKDIINYCQQTKENKLNNLIYFFGTIIIQKTSSGTKESEKFDYYLIDGQQRLTTFYLFWKSFLDIKSKFEENKESPIYKYKKNFCKESISGDLFKLSNKESSLENFILKSGKKNSKQQLENLNKNYEIIHSKMKDFFSSKEDIFHLEKILSNIVVCALEISSEQNAEEVFENINSKGKFLSISELIKNKLLFLNSLIKKQYYSSKNIRDDKEINLKYNKNEKQILDNFKFIESIENAIDGKKKHDLQNLGFKSRSDLIRAIISLVLKINIEIENEPYIKVIKPILETNYGKSYDCLSVILDEISYMIESFKITSGILTHDSESSFYLNWIFKKSSAFNIIVPKIIFDFIKKENIKIEELSKGNHFKINKKVREIYKIIVKGSIYSSGFSGINLWRDIPINLSNNKEIKIVEVIQSLIKNNLSLEEEGPEMSFYKNKIIDNDFYKIDKHLAKSLLLLIESKIERDKDRLEKKDWKQLNQMFLDNKWTIEHIIPMKINKDTTSGKKWTKMLGDDEYQSLINKIGNLTIAIKRMNSKMGNKSFEEKKKLLMESNLEINKEICKLESFNINVLKKRAEEIRNEIIKILD